MFDQQQRMGINLSQIDNLSKQDFIKQLTCLCEDATELPTPIDVYDQFSNFVPEDNEAKSEDEPNEREGVDQRFSTTRAQEMEHYTSGYV